MTSVEKANAFKEIQAATKRFAEMSRDFDLEMKYAVLKDAAKRRKFLSKSYEKLVNEIDVVQRQRRMEAIAVLARFIERYPNHNDYTPDVMFRLAELYFEKAQVDVTLLEQRYDKDRDLYDRGKIPSEPVSPTINFAETVKLYNEIIRRFPKFRYLAASLYLKGYCQSASGKEREAKDTWYQLATKYPKSKHAAEAWMRVGEYHFDNGEYRIAEKAYNKASTYKKSKYYGFVLYKLAWTQFSRYDYDRAIRGFKTLLEYYEELGGAEKSKMGQGIALSKEAIEYLARSLAEDDWDGDNEKDANAGVGRALSYLNEGKKYEIKILEAYAVALYELHEKPKYIEAAQVYRTLIGRDPNNPRNPRLHEKLIEAYYRAGDMAGSAKARKELVELYGKESPWYRANLSNAKATRRADKLVEMALLQQGKLEQYTAQKLKVRAAAEGNPGLLREAKQAYKRATKAYSAYLEAYPNTRHSYEVKFLLAEVLYYSDRYLDAAAQYALVRDLPRKKKYREIAAFSAISAIEQEMKALVKRKRLAKKALAEGDDPPEQEKAAKGTKIKRVKPQKLPTIVESWIKSSDRYEELKLERKNQPDYNHKLAYRVALVHLNYRHFDEARKRFAAIVKRWPLKQEASFAAANIINTYKIENDWENIEKWTEKIIKEGIGRPEDVAKLRAQIKTFKLGVQFGKAEALLADKQYVPAAREFERIVDGNPQSAVADKALFNAAIAYQNAKHWNSAARVFERVVVEPRFKGSKWREDALFFLAENNNKFYDFDKSIERYLALVRSFPESERVHYALYKSAKLQEMTGDLKSATATYQRYANQFPDRDDASQAFFSAGLVYEKLKDTQGQLKIWREFIKRYNQSPGSNTRIVEATMRMADIYDASGNWKSAKKLYQKTVAEFNAREFKPGSSAAYYAAKSSFKLIDRAFAAYERLKLQGSLANQGRIIQKKRKDLNTLMAQYVTVVNYKAFDWTIAALFRIGQLHELYAKMMYGAPDPPGLSDDEMDEYRTQVEDVGLQWENFAIEKYIVAVSQARKLKIVNDWTMKALKALNRYKPQDYPLFKAEKRSYQFGVDQNVPLTPPVLQGPKKDDGEPKPQEEEQEETDSTEPEGQNPEEPPIPGSEATDQSKDSPESTGPANDAEESPEGDPDDIPVPTDDASGGGDRV